MGKSANTVPPTDPIAASNAQTSSNIATAAYNAQLNRYNQTGPTGAVTWTNSGTPQNPQWTQATTLTPQQQQIQAQKDYGNNATQALANNLIQNSWGQLTGPASAQGLAGISSTVNGGNIDQARQQAQSAAYNSMTANLDPQYAQQGEQLQAQLANQGIVQGSQAYNNAMDNFQRQKAAAYQQAQNSAVSAGNDQANAQFGQGLSSAQLQNSANAQQLNQLFSLRGNTLNEIQALNSGSQVAVPSANPSQGIEAAPTNVSGNIAASQQQKQNNANAQTASDNANTSALASIAAAALMAFSDRRVKKDIEATGDSYNGHKLYSFRYKGASDDSPKQTGVMAQEVEKTNPEAVFKNSDGLRVVNYGAL